MGRFDCSWNTAHFKLLSISSIESLKCVVHFQRDDVCSDFPLHPSSIVPVLWNDHDGEKGSYNLGKKVIYERHITYSEF